MDRHLGATRNTYSTTSMMDAARAYGMLYQWGRKDPIPGSLDGTAAEVGVLFDGYGVSRVLKRPGSSSLEYAIKHPDTFCGLLYPADNSWGGGASKTIYDPCPDGWRVPDFDASTTKNLLAGFELKVGGTVKALVSNVWVNATFPLSYDVSNGYLYKESVWLPIVRMREYNTGVLRNPVASFCIWGAGGNGNFAYYYEAKNQMPGDGSLFPSKTVPNKSYGFSVRCIQQ